MNDVPAFRTAHRVVAAGANAWHEPRTDSPPDPPLTGGLAVEVVEVSGGWAHVRCSNGWTTWIAAAALEPLAPAPVPAVAPIAQPPAAVPASPAPRARSRVLPLLLGAVAVVLLGAIVVVVTTGGGDDDGRATTAPVTSTVTTRDVVSVTPRLDAPSGWATSPDGLVTAANADDLTAAVATGPRVTATTNPDVDPLAAFEAALGETYTVVGEPEQITVDGVAAVAVTLRWTWNQVDANGQPAPVDYVYRYIAARTGVGEGVLFEMSAPADQWESLAPTLEQVPAFG